MLKTVFFSISRNSCSWKSLLHHYCTSLSYHTHTKMMSRVSELQPCCTEGPSTKPQSSVCLRCRWQQSSVHLLFVVRKSPANLVFVLCFVFFSLVLSSEVIKQPLPPAQRSFTLRFPSCRKQQLHFRDELSEKKFHFHFHLENPLLCFILMGFKSAFEASR